MSVLLRLMLTLVACAGLYAAFVALIVQPDIDVLTVTFATERIELLAPRWLGIICGLPLLLFIGSFSLVDVSPIQRLLSAFVRALLIALIAIALARPSVKSVEHLTSTVYLVDVSESVSDKQLANAQSLLNAAWNARGDNDMHVVTFAGSARSLKIEKDAKSIPPLKRHPGKFAGQHSDIEAALQHAYGLFAADRIPRIAIISDGNETRGDVLAEAYRAADRGIRIHTFPLNKNRRKEVLVRELVIPQEVRMGAPFQLKATVFSTHAEEKVKFTLFKDEFINGLEGSKTVDLKPGMNTLSFRSQVKDSGFVNYRLVMGKVKHDTWARNNAATATMPVLGRPRVLYVEGEPSYAGYLKRSLEAEKLDVVVRGPYGVPRSAAALAKFDLLILSDVPAMYLGSSQMAAVQSYVRDLGGGFIMTGGPNSFGAGGYYGTKIEKILPVRLDTEKKRDQPSLGLMLAIDRSGSMSGPKIELAKEAAKATAEILGRSDLIGVVAFDSSAHVVVRLQRAANRLRILSDIARLRAGGGTNIKPALQESYSQLQAVSAKVKHVILLSDGQSSYSGIAELVDEMVSRKITVSAVGVGGGADRTLLQMIAERGNGRFYHTNDAANIPKIFTKETTQVARSAVVEELIKVHVRKNANLLDGVGMGSAPYLRGYVSTKPKPTSETILVSDYGEPILSMWRLGLGKVAAFTSDVKNRWAVNWLRWPGYGKFWAQLAREVMRHRIQRAFSMKARAEQGEVSVTVDAVDRSDRYLNGLDSKISVFDPRRPGRKQKFSLSQTAPGRYEGRFRLNRYGSFLIRATHRNDGKTIAESLSSIAVPYPKEYTSLIPDDKKMKRIATIAQGKVSPKAAETFDANGESISYHKDLWNWLLYIALGLFVLDVLLRRVRFFGYDQRWNRA